LKRIKGDSTVWENEPLAALAAAQQLGIYQYTRFLRPMDTLRDKNRLEELREADTAPWKVWE
jgi:glucose-1-phosphate cytidylyltransferase